MQGKENRAVDHHTLHAPVAYMCYIGSHPRSSTGLFSCSTSVHSLEENYLTPLLKMHKWYLATLLLNITYKSFPSQGFWVPLWVRNCLKLHWRKITVSCNHWSNSKPKHYPSITLQRRHPSSKKKKKKKKQQSGSDHHICFYPRRPILDHSNTLDLGKKIKGNSNKCKIQQSACL